MASLLLAESVMSESDDLAKEREEIRGLLRENLEQMRRNILVLGKEVNEE